MRTHSSGTDLLYRNRQLTLWNEFHEIATSSGRLPSPVYHLSTFKTQSHSKDLAGTIIQGARNHSEAVF